MTTPLTAQSFVRLLKAPTDPPNPESPLKIQIACAAWDDTTLHIPNKHELIAEFILTRLLKDKSKTSDNPVIDPRYWCLLCKVLDGSVGVGARGLKVWLGSLLNRTPLAPIIISILTLLNGLPVTEAKELLMFVRQCFSVIWPLSVHKIGVETLLECLGAVLDVSSELLNYEAMDSMCEAVVSSYREALGNVGNKKKLHATFLQTHLSSWIRAISRSSYLSPSLDEAVYAAGTETLFSLDALRASTSSESLFTALSSSPNSPFTTNPVIPLLPRIFSTHTHFLRRYRTTLFPASQNKTQNRENDMRMTSMAFFASCLKLLAGNDLSWEARVGLVSIIESERIYASQGVEEVEVVREDAVRILEGEAEGEVVRLALDVLAVLARVDYDVIEPVVGRVLPRLILTRPSPSIQKSANVLLNLLLDFHSKTRTLHPYSHALLDACTSLLSIGSLASPRELYSSARNSAILAHTHLSSLAQALRTFLTPTQVKEAAQITLALKDTFITYQNLSSLIKTTEMTDRPRKKRRKSESAPSSTSPAPIEDMQEVDVHALSLSLTLKFAALFLSNLPSSFVTAEVREAVREAGIWAVEVARSLLCDRASKISWADQVTGAAFLRFAYQLSACKCGGEQTDVQGLLDIVKTEEGVEGELVLEILRFCFARSSRSETDVEAETVFDVALTYVEAQVQNTSGLMVLYLIVERWLDLVDAHAPKSSLDRLIKLIFCISPTSTRQTDVQGLQPKDVLLGVLHNAQFWEMVNIRASVLAYLMASPNSLKSSMFDQLSSTYSLLLYVPPEYLTKQARVELVRRAIEGDMSISSSLHGTAGEKTAKSKRKRDEGKDREDAQQTLTHIRVFLQRMGQLGYLNTSDHESARDYVKHLLNTEISDNAVMRDATINLAELYIVALLRASDKDLSASAACASIFCSLAQSGSLEEESLPELCVLQLVERLRQDFSVSSLPDPIIASMKELHAALTPMSQSNVSDTLPSGGTIKTWARHLSFGHWLGVAATSTSGYGHQIAVALLRHREKYKCSAEILGLLFEELHCLPNVNRGMHLDLAVGVYVFSTEAGALDEVVSSGCKHLSVDDFSHILDTVYEALQSTQFPLAQRVRLVHAATVLLHDAPQGTLKVVQGSFSQCLNLFIGHAQFFAGPADLKVACLEYVARQCSDRPAALRPVDPGPIHTLLSKILCGSSTHDSTTTLAVFHASTTILNALVRLRRDLAVHILPHLGMILRQLVSCTRSLRPQLAAKQSRIVTDTLPSWIAPSEPLGVPEARALARLFTSLTTKTVPRAHMQPSAEQKAESLAKPFAKHAAYVVTAYIDAVNDPLCVMRADVRRELEPGLFSLCEMMGTHSRDAVMVSALDAGGKSVMKALWKEYEKQRYIGKG
ncbi:Urb2/Npa2 family-domain-containing protein [Suillus clintonianus]|uniref:Urb2/Npa2 family-domain-containing protein n=1 Tax=Suillus clintonianus TaxID=1904413 RepID=UPI001B85C629|nr:Urb2/Npa2 family-domain-containing protein [Suillus clintonianus]KAG2116977.1 Urb2/Npa2 family-domain-containing protein [Suillus clintonianus]